MTRIIAGSAKGRRLDVPARGTRPTSDKIREALFSRLENWEAVEGAAVLDLFAGSGALALEALSRGAARAILVEKSPKAAAIARANVASCGFSQQASVVAASALGYLHALPQEVSFDVVFLDPPYDLRETALSDVLDALAPHLDPDATVVIERDARSPEPALPSRLEHISARRWGDTKVWFAAAAEGET